MFINRRQAMANLALGASSLALTPFLQQLRAERATGKLPRRFVFVVKSSGFYPQDIQPEGLPASVDTVQSKALSELKLPEPLTPLAKHLDQVTVLRGLSAMMAKGGHHGFYGALGLYHVSGGTKTTSSPPLAATIDCVLGAHLPSIYNNLGFFPETNQGLITPAFISALGPRLPLPFYDAPELANNSLFGAVMTGESKQEFELQGDLMDHMIRDVRKFSTDLAGYEKEKMDRYLANFESIRTRRQLVLAKRDLLTRHVPAKDERYTKADSTLEERLRLVFELSAVALMTGLTNVVTIRTCNIGSSYRGELSLTDATVHGIGHGNSGAEGVDATQSRQRIKKFHCSLIAELADKLKAQPEGDGTMLDNTVITYLSDGGDAHHGDTKEVARVLVGGKNILRNQGRFLHYPEYGKKGHQTAASVYLAMLQGVGKPQQQFGRIDLNLGDVADQNAPLRELAL
ncbi:MAG: DUF1552 domain-containing protein [Gemmataceae bacterium]